MDYDKWNHLSVSEDAEEDGAEGEKKDHDMQNADVPSADFMDRMNKKLDGASADRKSGIK